MVFSLLGLSTCLKNTKLIIFSLISFSISRDGYPLLSNKYMNKPLLKMYNMHGLNEAFIALSCQKAIKLFVTVKKIFKENIFQAGPKY